MHCNQRKSCIDCIRCVSCRQSEVVPIDYINGKIIIIVTILLCITTPVPGAQVASCLASSLWSPDMLHTLYSALLPPFPLPISVYLLFVSGVKKNLTEPMICCSIYPLIVDHRIFAGIFSASGMLDDDWCRHSLCAGCGRSQEESV